MSIENIGNNTNSIPLYLGIGAATVGVGGLIAHQFSSGEKTENKPIAQHEIKDRDPVADAHSKQSASSPTSVSNKLAEPPRPEANPADKITLVVSNANPDCVTYGNLKNDRVDTVPVIPSSRDRSINIAPGIVERRTTGMPRSYDAAPMLRAKKAQIDALNYLDLAGTVTTTLRPIRTVQEEPSSLPSGMLERAQEFGREHDTLLSQPVVGELREVQQSLNELRQLIPQQLAGLLKNNLTLHQLSSGKDGTAFALQEYPALIGRSTTNEIQEILEHEFCKPNGVVLLPVRYDKRLSPIGNDSTFGVPHAVVLRADDPRILEGYVNAKDIDFEKPDARVLAWLMPNCAGSHPMKPNEELEEKRCSTTTLEALKKSVNEKVGEWECSLTSDQKHILKSAKAQENQLHAELKITSDNLPEGRYLLSQVSDSLPQEERSLLEKRDAITKPLREAKAMRLFNYDYMYAGKLRNLFPDDLLNNQSIARLDEQSQGNRFSAVMHEFEKGPSVFHCNPNNNYGALYRTFFSADAGKAIATWYEEMSRNYADRLADVAKLPQASFDRFASSMAINHKAQSPVTFDFEHTNNMFLKNNNFHLIDLAFGNRRSAPNNTTDLLKVLLNGCFVDPHITLAAPAEAGVKKSSQEIFKKVSCAAKTYKLDPPEAKKIYGHAKFGL